MTTLVAWLWQGLAIAAVFVLFFLLSWFALLDLPARLEPLNLAA